MERGCIYASVSPQSVLKSLAAGLAVATTIALVSSAVGWNSEAMAATVTLSPGANIQSAVNANPSGTIFNLTAGVYRQQSVTSLKNGDSFIGQDGAIMDGAKILTGWRQASINGVLYWTAPGGTPLPTPAPGCGGTLPCCVTGYPDCA